VKETLLSAAPYKITHALIISVSCDRKSKELFNKKQVNDLN